MKPATEEIKKCGRQSSGRSATFSKSRKRAIPAKPQKGAGGGRVKSSAQIEKKRVYE